MDGRCRGGVGTLEDMSVTTDHGRDLDPTDLPTPGSSTEQPTGTTPGRAAELESFRIAPAAEVAPTSRRAAREAEAAAAKARQRRQPRAAERPAGRPAQAKAKPRATRSQRNVRGIAVMLLMVPALFLTVALPHTAGSFGSGPSAAAAAADELAKLKLEQAQGVTVASGAPAQTVERDDYTATSGAELRRAEIAQNYEAYSGPTAAQYLENPAYPNFSLSEVVNVGLQYVGVPYVYGGATPAGFDCSGFVKYVYAQFGVDLPHSVPAQAARGTVISAADAQPGDLVIWSDHGHDGIYMGNGNVLHAPNPSKSVMVRPLYSFESVYYVRIGI
ncbi:hypothetical protein GCM10025874_26600 [Arenivirga flava]|uniref:NlpC/P60 domain-containing protein n=1 Tax=Arenivirga flava TaxID=1930060 RepID=A0AA37UVN7_9MICO|nr:hypothetical protein GCM10025874_26600 [Arenivirga flava]